MGVKEIYPDATSGIHMLFNIHARIEKVFQSPAMTGNGNLSYKDLNRHVRSVSRQIMTLTKQACGTA